MAFLNQTLPDKEEGIELLTSDELLREQTFIEDHQLK